MKAILQKHADDKGLKNTVFYIGDGFSGTTFDRPDFNRMINDIEAGKVEAVIIKDMSSFGRDYLKGWLLYRDNFSRISDKIYSHK